MDSEKGKSQEKSIVVFDGVCNFCNSSINFIIKNDSKDIFRFAAFQSEAGDELSKKYHFKFEDPDTLILIENGKVYERSTAALKITRHLGIYKIFYANIIVPRPIRDFFYKLIAKNRYRLFGKKDSCMVPTKEVRSKFL